MTLAGSGFSEGVTVAVGGAAARVASVEAGAVRFEMPSLAGAPGSRHDVVASMGARRTKPLPLYLGRVPLVVSFDPARGVADFGAGLQKLADGVALRFHDVARVGDDLRVIARVERKD